MAHCSFLNIHWRPSLRLVLLNFSHFINPLNYRIRNMALLLPSINSAHNTRSLTLLLPPMWITMDSAFQMDCSLLQHRPETLIFHSRHQKNICVVENQSNRKCLYFYYCAFQPLNISIIQHLIYSFSFLLFSSQFESPKVVIPIKNKFEFF